MDTSGVKSCGVSKKPVQDVGRLSPSWVRFSRSKYFIMEALPGETGKWWGGQGGEEARPGCNRAVCGGPPPLIPLRVLAVSYTCESSQPEARGRGHRTPTAVHHKLGAALGGRGKKMSRHFQVSAHEGKGSSGLRVGLRKSVAGVASGSGSPPKVGRGVQKQRSHQRSAGRGTTVSADRTESSPLVTALQSRCIRTLR